MADDEQPLRIPAGDIEKAVINALIGFLEDKIELTERFGPKVAGETQRLVETVRDLRASLSEIGTVQRRDVLQALQLDVRIAEGEVKADISGAGLASCLGAEFEVEPDQRWDLPVAMSLPESSRNGSAIVPAGNGEARPDMRLVTLIVKAQLARRQLFEGGTGEGIDFSKKHMDRLARLGFLAPDIVTAIMEGRQPAGLTGRQLLRAPEIPMDWEKQRELFGFMA